MSECIGVTDAAGLTSCELTPAAPGSYSLVAEFDGSSGYVESTGFSVLEPASGSGPDCSTAQPTKGQLWPPNHKFVPVGVGNVTDPDGDSVSVTMTGIFQDEPPNGPGHSDKCPDAKGVGTSTAQLRAERDGSGDGRVYHLSFTADDGLGGQCEGNVSVCVPHDQGKGSHCVDQGSLYDSTTCGSP